MAPAKYFADAIRSVGLRNVLVVDFLDAAGARTEKGVFFAASFASVLASQAAGFSLTDRWAWFSLLEKRTVAPADLEQPERIQHICAALGCDGVVTGRWTESKSEFEVSISLRPSAAGRAIAESGFTQKKGLLFAGYFPAVREASGIHFYFPGLDGIGIPKCTYCPAPEYSGEARIQRIQGAVTLSIVIGTDGSIQRAAVVQSLWPSLDKEALESVRTWKFEPLLDPSGRPVPVRTPLEVNFRLR